MFRKFIGGGVFGLGAIGKEMSKLDASDQQKANEENAARRRSQALAQQAKAISDAKDALAKYNTHLDDLKLKSGTTAEKMAILNKRFKEERDAAAKATTQPEGFEHLTKMKDIEEEIAKVKEDDRKAQEEADKKRQDAAEKEKKTREQIADASEATAKAAQSLAEGLKDRSAVTVGDLADRARGELNAVANYNSRHSGWMMHANLNQGERTALEIEQTEINAREARLSGNFGRSDFLTQRALNLRKSIEGYLKSSEADPMRSIASSQKEATKHLEELVKKASNEGIKIVPRNG
jgi:hypothetical protein